MAINKSHTIFPFTFTMVVTPLHSDNHSDCSKGTTFSSCILSRSCDMKAASDYENPNITRIIPKIRDIKLEKTFCDFLQDIPCHKNMFYHIDYQSNRVALNLFEHLDHLRINCKNNNMEHKVVFLEKEIFYNICRVQGGLCICTNSETNREYLFSIFPDENAKFWHNGSDNTCIDDPTPTITLISTSTSTSTP